MTSTSAVHEGRRLRELHPLADSEGVCASLYDLERTFVIEVPNELRLPLTADLRSQLFSPVVAHWLVSEDLLTVDARRPWTDPQIAEPPIVSDISLDMSGACNMGCHYCFENDIDSRLGPMSRGTAEASVAFAFRKADRSPHVTLHFGSGEPLMRFALLQSIVDQAETLAAELGKSIAFELTTNGTLVTDEIAEFVSAHPFNVRVSCDGPAEIHNRVRPMINGRDSYEGVERGLRRLLRAIPDRLTVNTVISGRTRLREVWDWARGLGIRHYHVIKVGAYRSSELDLRKEEIDHFRFDLKHVISEIRADLYAGRIPMDYQPITKVVRRLMIPQPITRFCGVGGSYLGVATNGKVYPCFRHIGVKEYELGSVLDDVNDEKRMAFRRKEAADVDSRDICRECWARYLCGGGCYADSVVYGPNKYQPQVQHCPFWLAEITAAIELFSELKSNRPGDCLALFGDNVETLFSSEEGELRFERRMNCS
jgi:uncharacterized protein